MFVKIVCDLNVLIIYLYLLSILRTNSVVMTAIIDSPYDKRFNKINNKFTEFYDKSGKCEIKIVTTGLCTINHHLVKPRIVMTHSMTNQKPFYFNSKPVFEERLRNHDSILIEEQKANEIVDQFISEVKSNYGRQLDPLLIKDFATFKVNNLGSVRVYDLSMRGFSNIKRHGSVRLNSDPQMKLWSIDTNLSIANISADFTVDAKLKNNVFIRGWTLQVLIKQCLLNAILEFDSHTRVLSISSLVVSSIEGFDLNGENLSFPFNMIVKHILDHQMEEIKSVIGNNAQKYFSQTLQTFDVSKIIGRMAPQMLKLRNSMITMRGD